MGLRITSVLCLALFLAFSSCIHGLDINTAVSKYPEFSTFSSYLTQSKLVDQINGEKAITVLALGDDAASSFSGKPEDYVKLVLENHVITNYQDEKNLFSVVGSHEKLPTLSSSGIFVNLINDGEVAFSAVDEKDKYESKLVRTVETQPGTVSILEVNKPIVSDDAAAAATGDGKKVGGGSRAETGLFVGIFIALVSILTSL
ncbi:hypothetical protein PIB30_065123 [Stylosanthes scabra]|uniref:FAS1 domain-containing protein n=1 Tax=Stylosanthes scabra TaxID=79078 RepID=A0ABU6RLY7_9FABA|nr:hypothetical protein [Stylosanthes scabra]